jgi:sugar lactone lactonase YvrE
MSESFLCPDVLGSQTFQLGESPVWLDRSSELLFVDLEEGSVHSYSGTRGTRRLGGLGMPVGAVAPVRGGGLVLATRDGFVRADESFDHVELLAPVSPEDPTILMNDGKCDPRGRFWAGTMDSDGRQGRGSLFRLEAVGAMAVIEDVSLSNGIGWNDDGSLMYYVDSPTRRVDVFDFDLDAGEPRNRRPFVVCDEDWGLPDGLAVDEEGCVWVAFWGGFAVRRFGPDGSVVGGVAVPASQVTSCAFGGHDRQTLFITSAGGYLTDAERSAQPHAGAVFAVDAGVRGVHVSEAILPRTGSGA